MDAPVTERDEAVLRAALDRGIDDMEAGRVHTHEDAVKMIRQRLREHVAVQNSGNR